MATHSTERKRTKNSRAEPKSFSKIMTTRENPQAARTGARYLGSGVTKGPIRNVARPSSSRRCTRYPAKKMARASFASSPGWNPIGPIRVQMRAPLMDTPTPGTIGRISRTTPTRPTV